MATAAGHDLADVAERLETEVMAAEGRVLGRDAELRGRLRVATVDFIYRGYVDVFTGFMERYPGVDLTVCASYDEVSLRRREADVAIRLGNQPAEHLVGRRIGQVAFAIYASRNLVERVGRTDDLSAFPWLRTDERTEDRAFDAWLAKHAPGHRVRTRFDSYTVLRAAGSSGVGVHIMPCLDGDADADLVTVGPAQPEAARGLWVLTLPELRTNSRVRAFMDHVYDAMGPRLDRLDATGA